MTAGPEAAGSAAAAAAAAEAADAVPEPGASEAAPTRGRFPPARIMVSERRIVPRTGGKRTSLGQAMNCTVVGASSLFHKWDWLQ